MPLTIESLVDSKVGGTWTVLSGAWEIPAVTLGGSITGNSKQILGLLVLEGTTSTELIIRSMVTTATAYGMVFNTPNAAGTQTTRFKIGTGTDTVAATWANITQVGLVLGGNMTVSAYNLVTDTTTGTKIGTATNQKLGFFNATPVVQQTGCAVPTDLNTCIEAITALRTALNNLGLTTVV